MRLIHFFFDLAFGAAEGAPNKDEPGFKEYFTGDAVFSSSWFSAFPL